jgi:hypothetical protein
VSLSEALITLGRVRLVQGKAERAKKHFYEALELAWNEGPRWLMVWALEVVSWFLVEQMQMEKAVKLFAVVDAQRGIVHSPLRQADVGYHDRAITKAYETLGQVAFETLWQEAEMLPLVGIMTMALEQVKV